MIDAPKLGELAWRGLAREILRQVTTPPAAAGEGTHGAKHIARLEKRALALSARMEASPHQADFADEAAELKSIRWVIDELAVKTAQLHDFRTTMADAAAELASLRGGEPVAWRYRYKPNGAWKFATSNLDVNSSPEYESEPLYVLPPSPQGGGNG